MRNCFRKYLEIFFKTSDWSIFRCCIYRSWLGRLRNEKQPFLTITSLELPECSVPLIDSESSARCKRIDQNVSDKDEILEGFLEKVVEVNKEREKEKCVVSDEPVKKVRKARKQGIELLACTKGPATLEECTRNIVEGIRLC